jgi:hypothetical protein
MSKARQSNKEAKKQPVMTPKEKKGAEQSTKYASDIVPLFTRWVPVDSPLRPVDSECSWSLARASA